MTERKFHINIPRGNCIYHSGEDFACVKQQGPLSEEDAQGMLEVLREILPDLSGNIKVVKKGEEAPIPQMCQDCRFRTASIPENGKPSS